jgi:hypothetical protein
MQRIWLILSLVLAGCAASATAPAKQRFAGFYESGFEVESFQPCGSGESWWVTEGEEIRAARQGDCD